MSKLIKRTQQNPGTNNVKLTMYITQSKVTRHAKKQKNMSFHQDKINSRNRVKIIETIELQNIDVGKEKLL